MFTTKLLDRDISRGHFTLPPLVATYAGSAEEPHGGSAGCLFSYGDETYFVPIVRYTGGQFRAEISSTKRLVEKTSDMFKDMTFAPVDAGLINQGLGAALQAAIRHDYPRASAENRLTFQ